MFIPDAGLGHLSDNIITKKIDKIKRKMIKTEEKRRGRDQGRTFISPTPLGIILTWSPRGLNPSLQNKMADNEAASHEREQSLDFLSANFDPLQALYTKDLKPPIPSIQVFNNLGEYARVIKEGKPKTVPQKDPRKMARLRRAASRRTRNLKPEYKPPDISTRLKEIASNRVAREELLSSERRGSISGQDEDGSSRDKKENPLGFGRGRSGKKKYMNVLEKMDGM